ncbi:MULTISPECIES: DUF6461 domain-containing protein [unclassified Streptomyces]|uniref:DUF6461 domain-containing protein n=1 Tax=unclassified Streptomyces TaxID=2593676 RepID=UPI002E2D29C1|nr:DUF6461 domain-containing protein [Streptomyces sp. NBC_00273]
MSSGIQWLVDQDDWQHGVVFARGIEPQELGVRMGGTPGSVVSPITDTEAWNMVLDLATDDDDVVRVGACGGWAFAVEYGMGNGGDRLVEISRNGVEAIHLDPSPDHPPAMFSYARDGADVCSFGIGEEGWRWGEQPDLLLPELVAAGVLHPDGAYARPDGESYLDRDRHTLALIETRFGLFLPRDEVVNQRLPAFLI